MCYRYSVPGKEILEKRFNASFNKSELFNQRHHVGFYDQVKLPIITNEEPEKIKLFNWGLIPFWIKDKKTADAIKEKTANARSESIFEKPSFRYSAQKKHCIVLADGFYEWRNYLGKNYPYYVYLKNKKPLAIAGLWDTWTSKINNNVIHSFTIITTKANPMMEKIHNKKKRMPVILKDEKIKIWLNKEIDKDTTLNLLTPLNEKYMKAHTISNLITQKNTDHNIPDVKKPFIYPNLEPYFG